MCGRERQCMLIAPLMYCTDFTKSYSALMYRLLKFELTVQVISIQVISKAFWTKTDAWKKKSYLCL